MNEQAQSPPVTSHFDAAKSIVEALKGLDKPLQALAIRFASETLGIQEITVAQKSIPPGVTETQVSSHGATHSTDIRQFTAAKAPKSDQQFAAVAAYFYRFEATEANRKDSIDADILREAARLADRKRLTNPLATLNNAKNSGFLDVAGSGKFQINAVGENLVAMALPENASDSPPKRHVSKRKVVTKKKSKTANPRG